MRSSALARLAVCVPPVHAGAADRLVEAETPRQGFSSSIGRMRDDPKRTVVVLRHRVPTYRVSEPKKP